MTSKVAMDQLKNLSWMQMPPMQSQREGGAAVAIMGSKILVVGGYHVEQKFLKSCAVFDVSTMQWSDYPPMKTARMGCAAVFLEQHNAVVVVGGFQRGRKYLDTVEYLDLSTLHWHRLPPMQNPRAGCAAVTVLGKRVVVLGGWMDGENAAGTVEVLDFNAQQWHSLPEMATPRAGCSAAALGHRVLVLGGHTTSGKHRGCRASVEVLDLSTQKWSKLPSMKEKRDASASCAIGNCVLVLGGGETSNSPTSSAEIFDVDRQVWSELPRMKAKRFGCSAAVVGNKVVVIGGRGEDGKHLETVECLEIPMHAEGSVSLGSFLDMHHVAPSTNDANGDLKSLANTITTLIEHDKHRINTSYEASIKQAQEMVRTVNLYLYIDFSN
jgi:N-acetylneuraminic acid mutarotase